MGLPWPEWGETDYLLTQAYAVYRSKLCPCGCGHWVDDCLSEATDGRWQVEVDRCYARAAIEAFRDAHPDLDPGALVSTRLLPEGEDASDSPSFDPAIAAREYAELQARLGLAG